MSVLFQIVTKYKQLKYLQGDTKKKFLVLIGVMGWFSLSCVTSLLTINFDVINFWNYQQIMSLFCLTGYYFDNFCPYENTNFTHILIGYYNKGPVFLWMYLTELNRRYLILNFKISPATAFVAREKPPTEEQISTWKVVRDFLENNKILWESGRYFTWVV